MPDEQAGVPAEYAAILADSDAGAARGGLDVETGHLQMPADDADSPEPVLEA